MRKAGLLVALVLSVLALVSVLSSCSALVPKLGPSASKIPDASLPPVSTVQVGAVDLAVVATFATEAEREHGLMGRTIAPGQAGVFTFGGKPSTASFWMLNTPQSLSLLWVAAGRVVGTVEMPVCKLSCPSYKAPAPFDVAVEAVAGTFAHVKPGQLVNFG